jgi:hypothetical protein
MTGRKQERTGRQEEVLEQDAKLHGTPKINEEIVKGMGENRREATRSASDRSEDRTTERDLRRG